MSAEYHVALKFEEICDTIRSYDNAFNACNATREKTPKYHYYQVKNWNLNTQTLYANTTVPPPLLDCLYTEIPRAISSNDHSDWIVLGEIFGSIVGAAVLVWGVLWCCSRSGSSRRTASRHVRCKRRFQQDYALGDSWNTFTAPRGDIPRAHLRNASF